MRLCLIGWGRARGVPRAQRQSEDGFASKTMICAEYSNIACKEVQQPFGDSTALIQFIQNILETGKKVFKFYNYSMKRSTNTTLLKCYHTIIKLKS